MSKVMLGRDLSRAIAEALDLDTKQVISVTITATPDEFALATVQMFIGDDDIERIATIVRRVKDNAVPTLKTDNVIEDTIYAGAQR